MHQLSQAGLCIGGQLLLISEQSRTETEKATSHGQRFIESLTLYTIHAFNDLFFGASPLGKVQPCGVSWNRRSGHGCDRFERIGLPWVNASFMQNLRQGRFSIYGLKRIALQQVQYHLRLKDLFGERPVLGCATHDLQRRLQALLAKHTTVLSKSSDGVRKEKLGLRSRQHDIANSKCGGSLFTVGFRCQPITRHRGQFRRACIAFSLNRSTALYSPSRRVLNGTEQVRPIAGGAGGGKCLQCFSQHRILFIASCDERCILPVWQCSSDIFLQPLIFAQL